MSLSEIPASSMACSVGPTVRSIRSEVRLSKVARVIEVSRWTGPESVAVMKGRLILASFREES